MLNSVYRNLEHHTAIDRKFKSLHRSRKIWSKFNLRKIEAKNILESSLAKFTRRYFRLNVFTRN